MGQVTAVMLRGDWLATNEQRSTKNRRFLDVDVVRSTMRRLSTPVLSVEQVPSDVREVAILRGYRPPSLSVGECVLSVFNPTNETLNFWTHFLPAWYFVWHLSQLSGTLISDPHLWPFLSFMIICCVYPLASCMAHAFCGMSLNARHICFFVDYGCLSLYSYGAAVIYRSYSFPESFYTEGWADIYLLAGLFISAFSTVGACSSRFFLNHWVEKALRVGAFASAYLWGGLPLLFRVVECAVEGDRCVMPSFAHHARQFVVSFLGGFVYSLHVPERLAPGCFDIVGHSHQWLHICAVLATNEQMMGALIDMQQRDFTMLFDGWMSPQWICFSVFALFCWDLLVVLAFSFWTVYCTKRVNTNQEARKLCVE